jgi:hypothetical protein
MVVQHGVGDHLHTGSGRLNPPAEVDVVAEQPEVGIEPAEPVPYVAPDEHAGRAHREHGALVVVLALVDLAGIDAGDAAACPVDGHADLTERPPVLAVEHLRPEDHDRAVLGRRPQQLVERVRGRLAVVVQQPDPLDARDAGIAHAGLAPRGVPQRDRNRLAVSRRPVHAEHRVLADQLGEHGPAAVSAPGVDGDRLLDRVRLGAERLDETGQQASTVMRDDDRGNGMPGSRCGWQ